jgi:hypothetical protein
VSVESGRPGTTTVVTTAHEVAPSHGTAVASSLDIGQPRSTTAAVAQEEQSVIHEANPVTGNLQVVSSEASACLGVMHGCWTFAEFLSSLDTSDLECAEEDLLYTCNITRKEISVISCLQTQLLNMGQESRAAELEKRSVTLESELAVWEIRHRTACTLQAGRSVPSVDI